MKRTRQDIKDFIEKYCTECREGDNVELIMDDHKCIRYNKKEYYIPENNSFWTEFEENIQQHLINKFHI